MDRIIQSRYWNTNGIGIAIVAVTGGNNDVAAYIGASSDGAEREQAALDWTIKFGAKLQRVEAYGMLPGLEDKMTGLGLHYRP